MLSQIKNFGPESHGNASTICRAVHFAVGFSVTLKCTTRRLSCIRTINTYKTRKVAVATVKKSSASREWFEAARSAEHAATSQRLLNTGSETCCWQQLGSPESLPEIRSHDPEGALANCLQSVHAFCRTNEEENEQQVRSRRAR